MLADKLGASIFHTNDHTNIREAIFLLFDPINDRFDDEWVHSVARTYDKEDRLFRPHIANQLYIYSALNHEGFMGACGAFYLGKKYLLGHEREIDPQVAAQWFELALDKGHAAAKMFLSNIYRQYDPRYKAPGEEQFTARVDDLLKEDRSPPVLHQYTVDSLWRGTDPEVQKKALANFQDMADGYSPYKLSSRWHIAMRSLLGLSAKRDLANVEEYIDMLPDIDDAVKSDIEYASQKEELARIVTAAKTPELEAAYKRAAEAICKWYTTEDNGSALEVVIADLLRPVRDTLRVASRLAGEEEWRVAGQMSRKLSELHRQQVGITHDELKKSALIMGPRYNPIGENGLPLLGTWAIPAESAAAAEQEMAEHGSYVPTTGVGIYKGLTTTADGYIRFNCSQSGIKPALLSQEDFDVAMLLAFADEKDVIWPYLSMESAEKQLTDGHAIFKTKKFHPEWMGHTDFGRTMYITDVLCGALAWNQKSFPLAEVTTEEQRNRNEEIRSFLDYLHWTGGRSTRSTSSRVMLRSEHHQITGLEPEIENGRKIWNLEVKDVKMRVDGSYVLKKTNGEEDRLVALNDTTYQQGAITQKITDNYDYIAGIMPVFERARQLMGLFYSLAELRKAGFQPNPKLIAELKTRHQRYAKLPELPRNQLWVQPFPHYG